MDEAIQESDYLKKPAHKKNDNLIQSIKAVKTASNSQLGLCYYDIKQCIIYLSAISFKSRDTLHPVKGTLVLKSCVGSDLGA